LVQSIFHGRNAASGTDASIGPKSDRSESPRLRITAAVRSPGERVDDQQYGPVWLSWGQIPAMLHIEAGENHWQLDEEAISRYEGPDRTSERLESDIGPPFLKGTDISRNAHETALQWDRLALTDGEKRVLDALTGIEPRVEALSFVAAPRYECGRIAKVRLAGSPKPIPLASLGDGIVRMFQIAVAMQYAATPAGAESPSKLPPTVFPMLLIDEVEAGIHYSLHADLWRFIFKAAKMLEVQVFATTHSWDCVKGFSEALKDAGSEDGLLIRLEKAEGRSETGAVIIDRDDLPIVVRESIEVR